MKIFSDLDTTLKQMTFNEIIVDTDYHFENSFITNFDLIHNDCRGDKLSYSRKHYETISNEKVKKEIASEEFRNQFISSAIRSERKDLVIEKEILEEHFNRQTIEKNLEKKGVFLSSFTNIELLHKPFSSSLSFSMCDIMEN